MMLCANYYITPSTYVIFWENVENEIFFEFGPAYLTYLTGKLFKTVAYAYLIRYLRIKNGPYAHTSLHYPHMRKVLN